MTEKTTSEEFGEYPLEEESLQDTRKQLEDWRKSAQAGVRVLERVSVAIERKDAELERLRAAVIAVRNWANQTDYGEAAILVLDILDNCGV